MHEERTTLIRRIARQRDEGGAILVLAAVGMVMAVFAAALSIDIGRLAQDRRQDRKVADLAALDAVRQLPNALSVQLAAGVSADRNGLPCAVAPLAPGLPCTLRPTGFSVVALPGTTNSGGFTTLFDPLVGPDAVQVTVTSRMKNRFAGGQRDLTVKSVATLGNGHGCALPDLCVRVDGSPLGTVKVGSTLASVTTENIILNKLLAQTMGGSYSLDAVGWQGLAAGNVSFKRLRTALGYSAGTTDAALDANITYRQLLDATVNALNADGSPSSVLAATKLATIASRVSATAGTTMTLRRLFDVTGNVGSGKDVADASMNVKDVVVGGLTVADDDHFASMRLTASDIPTLPGNYVDVKFGLIEAPQVRSGPAKDGSGYRTIAHTGQIRLQIMVNMDVSVLGLGVLNLNVPYYLEIGAADGKLDTLRCASGADVPTGVDILGTTDAGRTVVGEVADASLRNPAGTPVPALNNIVNVLGVTFKANTLSGVTVTIPGNPGTMKTFTPPYSATAASQHVNASAFSLPALTAANTTTTGGGLLGGLVQTTLLSTVTALVPSLTTSLLNPLMKGLGVSYAGADIWAPPPQHCTPTSFNTDTPPVPYDPVPSLIA